VFFFLPQFSVDSAYKAGSNSKLVYASLRWHTLYDCYSVTEWGRI
jgi:hypothetical protein